MPVSFIIPFCAELDGHDHGAGTEYPVRLSRASFYGFYAGYKQLQLTLNAKTTVPAGVTGTRESNYGEKCGFSQFNYDAEAGGPMKKYASRSIVVERVTDNVAQDCCGSGLADLQVSGAVQRDEEAVDRVVVADDTCSTTGPDDSGTSTWVTTACGGSPSTTTKDFATMNGSDATVAAVTVESESDSVLVEGFHFNDGPRPCGDGSKTLHWQTDTTRTTTLSDEISTDDLKSAVDGALAGMDEVFWDGDVQRYLSDDETFYWTSRFFFRITIASPVGCPVQITYVHRYTPDGGSPVDLGPFTAAISAGDTQTDELVMEFEDDQYGTLEVVVTESVIVCEQDVTLKTHETQLISEDEGCDTPVRNPVQPSQPQGYACAGETIYSNSCDCGVPNVSFLHTAGASPAALVEAGGAYYWPRIAFEMCGVSNIQHEGWTESGTFGVSFTGGVLAGQAFSFPAYLGPDVEVISGPSIVFSVSWY